MKVPLGTEVRKELEGGELRKLGDVVRPGERLLVASGGRGGRGNARFATATHQAPREAEGGRQGEEAWLQLDLKLLADVGLVGYPNAGKSTLLSVATRARPKIADYPFTTLEPVLGVVELGYDSFVMADIPGLIEGAHEGHGLGLGFLRHIERTEVLIQVVDGGGDDPVSDARKTIGELEVYGAGLEAKPRIIALNKVDLPEVRARAETVSADLQELGLEVLTVSAATGEGVDGLLAKACEVVRERRGPGGADAEKPEDDYKVFRPQPEDGGRGRHRRENG